MNSTLPDMSGMDVLGLTLSNPSSQLAASHHAHPYASSISSSASSSSSSVFSLDCVSQSSISSTSTNPVDVIWENESNSHLAGRNPNGACPRAFAKGPASRWTRSQCAPSSMSVKAVRTEGELRRQPRRLLRSSGPLSAAASRSDAATGSKGVLPLHTFIQETLRRSRTSYSTLQVALYYLIKIKPHVPTHDFTKEQPRDQSPLRAMQCGRRMFLAALILASKYLQDRSYSARAWSKISGLNTLEINQNELMFLKAVGWRLHIDEATFQRWTDLVLKLTPGAGGPPVAKGQCWQTVLPKLTPELDFVESESVTPVSAMGGMDLGLSEFLSPCSLPSNESVRSLPREQTPTHSRRSSASHGADSAHGLCQPGLA
ncbi:hypothetical protein N7472_006960 [Penicillium cf. griseofulvum]|uniref:Cyclin N-terminal domain-containing protein n=1 Tax=Penicillium cf. griseofulvum TaxID=2972120 RepID=A0A9W9JDQ5_9EURO|nr:hypothetical protein N7472_006960 [Penicillium cf. griseofulvum]